MSDYHEPIEELSQNARSFTRAMAPKEYGRVGPAVKEISFYGRRD